MRGLDRAEKNPREALRPLDGRDSAGVRAQGIWCDRRGGMGCLHSLLPYCSHPLPAHGYCSKGRACPAASEKNRSQSTGSRKRPAGPRLRSEANVNWPDNIHPVKSKPVVAFKILSRLAPRAPGRIFFSYRARLGMECKWVSAPLRFTTSPLQGARNGSRPSACGSKGCVNRVALESRSSIL